MPADSPNSVADDITNSKTKRKGFLDLPAELRISICRHAFSTLGRVTPVHTADVFEVRVNLPAHPLACCKTINNEARPIFFEVTDFVLKEPGDLLRLRAVAGRFAAAIIRLTFNWPSLIHKTTIEELRPFKLLRAVNIGILFPWGDAVVRSNTLRPQRQLDTTDFCNLRGADKYLFKLVQ